jgi:hypothetical protein
LANALFDQHRDIEALSLYRGLTRLRDVVGDRARVNIARVRKRLGTKLMVVKKARKSL